METKKILKITLITIVSIILIGLLTVVILVNRKFTDDMAGYLLMAYENGVTAEDVGEMLVELQEAADNLPEGEVSSMEAFGVLNDLLLIVTDRLDADVAVDIMFYGKSQKVSLFQKFKLIKTYGLSNIDQVGATATAGIDLLTAMDTYIVKYQDVLDRVLLLSYVETELLVNFTYDVVNIINYPQSSSEEGQAEQLITLLQLAGGDLTGLDSLDWISLCTFIAALNDDLNDTAELVSVISYILGYGYISYNNWFDLAFQIGDYFVNLSSKFEVSSCV